MVRLFGNNNNDKNKKISEKMDITNKKNFRFKKIDLINVNETMKNITTEIYNLNDLITKTIVKYQETIGSDQDPKLRSYVMTYSDYRYLYEELLNLILVTYIMHVKLAKEYYLNTKDFALNRSPLVDTTDTYNPVDIDFDIKMAFSSVKISRATDTVFFQNIKSSIDKCVGRLVIYNNKMVNVVMENYVRETRIAKLSRNDYIIFFNQQYIETISQILTVSNICKNHWFKNMALRAINNVDEKLG
jgi:hypothetical protein